jgi:hypothetical protein
MKLKLNAAHLLGEASSDCFGLLFRVDNRVFRSSLNFKAVKTGEPRLEYSIPPMKRFTIPTSYQVDTLKARIAELEAEISKMKSEQR